jgi:hypothetical protein
MKETPTTLSPANRRNSRRFGINGSAKIECRKGSLGLGPNLLVATLDISESGIRLVLKAHLPPKQEVEIQLQGGGLVKPLKCLAKVAWSLALEDGTFCTGIHFDRPVPYIDMQRLTKLR